MLTARRRASVLPAESPSIQPGTLERRTAELSGGRVAYLRHGSGPPLLLVHGIPTSARLWEPLLGDLGEHYDCIAPDLLGLGRSLPHDDAQLDSPGQADMLAELLDHLGIGTARTVFHDQGGAHGQQLLARHPDRVDAVVFTDCVCFDNWPVPLIAMLMAMTRAPAVFGTAARSGILQRSLGVRGFPQAVKRLPTVPQPYVDDWLHALGPDAEPGALEAFRRYVGAQSSRWTIEAVPVLASWSKPAGVVWATDDQYIPPRWGARLAATLPTADPRPIPLPDAGHFFHVEVPRTAARAILDAFG
jgi:pimeloyl-ACP methyl ester carboxylesterase